jgi:uncharacterized DUF497 family protein
VAYEFRWNDHNVGHIAGHGVEIDEAEYVVRHPDSGFPRAEGDGKYLVWGQTAAGRYPQVVYIFSPANVVYVIHARSLDEQEKRRLRRWRK